MLQPKIDLKRDQAISRSLGCVLGGAVGDSLGSPIEFYKMEQIRREFGPKGIQEIAPSWGKPAAITDDTQMTLFTAEGLIRAQVRMENKGICHIPSAVANAYQRWFKTQGERGSIEVGNDGWLVGVDELHSRRAPGNTCVEALKSMKSLGDLAVNDSKGCGGVMRAAPVGIFGFRAEAVQVFELASETAHATHGHSGGYLPAGCLAVIISELMKGTPLEEAVDVAAGLLRQQKGHEETSKLIKKARNLAESSDVGPESLQQALGEGWVGDSALAIAVACSLVAHDFDQGIRLAVNHDGDSDSTGAITGNICGARWGIAAIDYERWLSKLELRDVIAGLAHDLAVYPEWDLTDSRVWTLYPGN